MQTNFLIYIRTSLTSLFLLLFLATQVAISQNPTSTETSKKELGVVKISGELKKWHKITLTFDGPDTSEMDKLNPFMNYKLDVYFTHAETGKTMKVPGYFAADGNAGETSASAGNKWRVHFAAEETGKWTYKVDFRKGNWAAVSERKVVGTSGAYMDGLEGSFVVDKSDKSGRDNRGKGRLKYDGTRYLKYAETGKPMLKVGPDSPENFLSYAEFDGTAQKDGHKDDLVKTWEPHLKDWKEGDPTWKNGQGKAIMGAINYLVTKGMNTISFITLNIGGDDQNEFPFVDYDTHDRYDCSKLDQWEVVLSYADLKGMFLHIKLVEQESQGLLDNGAIGAYTRLYYREMVARFGHHLALNWNIGEESGDWAPRHKTPPMNTTQRLAAADWFYQNDPYRHHTVLHCPPAFDDILGPNSKYSGVSVQLGTEEFRGVHESVMKWLKLSKGTGKQWAVSMDEPGGAKHALLPDNEDSKHDNARMNSLWGSFLGGAWGNEFYFGYDHPHSDLTCQDFRSRDLFWNQCKYLLDFFEMNQIEIQKTENYDNLVQKGDYCLAEEGKMYIVFLRKGSGTINLENQSGEFTVKWFDPRNGGKMQNGTIKSIKGGKEHKLDGAPSEPAKDWVVLLTKKN